MTTTVETAHTFSTDPMIDRECGCYEFPLRCSCGWQHTACNLAEVRDEIERHWRNRNSA